MIILSSTSDLLTLDTSTGANIDIHVSWIDFDNAGGRNPGRFNATVTSGTTTIVPSPASGVQRSVKRISIRNRHATTSNTVLIKHTDGTTAVEVFRVETLGAGECLMYGEEGFRVYDVTGAIKLIF